MSAIKERSWLEEASRQTLFKLAGIMVANLEKVGKRQARGGGVKVGELLRRWYCFVCLILIFLVLADENFVIMTDFKRVMRNKRRVEESSKESFW